MLISAVIGIVSFVLAIFPSGSLYFEAPMGIIGKIYANSMLVLISSRMVLGSEEPRTPSTVISALKFGTAPANLAEAENGDVAVDTRVGAGLSGSSGPEGV